MSEDGATNLTFTVTRSLNLSSPTTVNITTGGTATSGTDYAGGVATVVIPGNATTATITIDPTVDGTVEPDETVTLIVAAGTGYTVGAPANATATILNDDVPSATITVSPAAVAEDGAPNLVYTVTLNQAAFNRDLGELHHRRHRGQWHRLRDDHFAADHHTGLTTGTITVNPTADATIEADETVILTLAAGTGYTVGVPNSATSTILNDDLPNLTINDVTTNEGNAGITNFTFTVSLSAPAGPGGVTFDIATANGSATAGVDYVASTLTSQTIPAGSSTYTFTVLVNGDTLNEPSDTFFVNVTNVINAVVVDGQGVGTIVNDDPLPSLSINDVTVVEGNAGTVNAVFTVTLSAASGQIGGRELRHGRRHRDAAGRLHQHQRHADVHAGPDHPHHHRAGDRRNRAGGERDLLRQPQRRDQRDHHRQPGPRHHHQRRRAGDGQPGDVAERHRGFQPISARSPPAAASLRIPLR